MDYWHPFNLKQKRKSGITMCENHATELLTANLNTHEVKYLLLTNSSIYHGILNPTKL